MQAIFESFHKKFKNFNKKMNVSKKNNTSAKVDSIQHSQKKLFSHLIVKSRTDIT